VAFNASVQKFFGQGEHSVVVVFVSSSGKVFELSVELLVLRYKQPEEPEWKVPLNFRIAGREFPLGLGLITIALFTMAMVNLFTKKIATIWGLTFTLTIFVIFKASEHYNRKRRAHAGEHEKFRLVNQEMISHQSINWFT